MKAKIWQEIRSMTVTEMEAKLNESKEKLFRMRFRHSSTPLKNPLEIRFTRRLIAKLNTLLNQARMESQQKES
jgi:large subunit ribosomal protein L29